MPLLVACATGLLIAMYFVGVRVTWDAYKAHKSGNTAWNALKGSITGALPNRVGMWASFGFATAIHVLIALAILSGILNWIGIIE